LPEEAAGVVNPAQIERIAVEHGQRERHLACRLLAKSRGHDDIARCSSVARCRFGLGNGRHGKADRERGREEKK